MVDFAIPSRWRGKGKGGLRLHLARATDWGRRQSRGMTVESLMLSISCRYNVGLCVVSNVLSYVLVTDTPRGAGGLRRCMVILTIPYRC